MDEQTPQTPPNQGVNPDRTAKNGRDPPKPKRRENWLKNPPSNLRLPLPKFDDDDDSGEYPKRRILCLNGVKVRCNPKEYMW